MNLGDNHDELYISNLFNKEKYINPLTTIEKKVVSV